MNKFFKRILPATILATCCTVSVFSMTACNDGKDYSEDFAKLQQQIDDQKNQINDLKNENSSLKDQISNITPGDTDYTEEIEKLQQQIETLKTQNGSNLSEISKLEQQLENLKTNNENNLAEIDKLQQQINNQKLLIESLQNAVNVEPKIYKVGETFTYSYQGVEFFSLTLLTTESTIGNTFRIKNLNMSGGGGHLLTPIYAVYVTTMRIMIYTSLTLSTNL